MTSLNCGELTPNHDEKHTGEDEVVHVEERSAFYDQGTRYIWIGLWAT